MDFLVLARDLSTGLAAFHIDPGGVTTLAVGASEESSEILERRLRSLAAESLERADPDEAVIVWEGDIPVTVDSGLTEFDSSLRAVAVPVRSGAFSFGVLGIADYWLPEPVTELRQLLRDVASSLAGVLDRGEGDVDDRVEARPIEPEEDNAWPASTDVVTPISPTGPIAPVGPIGPIGIERDTFLTELLDHLPEGLLVTRVDGTIVYVNRRIGELSQHSVSELLGMDVASILEPVPGAASTPSESGAFSPRPGSVAFLLDTPPEGRMLTLISSASEPSLVEVRGTFFFSASAGECYTALIRPAPRQAGAPYFAATATSAGPTAGRAEEIASQLDAESGPLAAIFDSLEDGVLVCDRAGVVVLANAAAATLQGLAPDSLLVGQPFPTSTGLRRSDGTGLAVTDHPLARALAGTVVEGEMLTLIDEAGERRRVIASARPHPVAGGEGAMLVLRDATSQADEQTRRVSTALRDPLTGLANRELLLDYMYRSFEQLKTRGGDAAFVYLDLVDFKRINDHYGWETGDETLVAVARRIARAARSSDLVARTGGDEFVLLPHSSADRAVIDVMADRLVQVVGARYSIRGRAVRLAASVVCVTADPRGDDPSALLVRASREVYRRRRERSAAEALSDQAPQGV